MVPLTAGQGTWRQTGTFRAEDWHVVPNSLPKHLAATLGVKCASLSPLRFASAHICQSVQFQCHQSLVTSHRSD